MKATMTESHKVVIRISSSAVMEHRLSVDVYIQQWGVSTNPALAVQFNSPAFSVSNEIMRHLELSRCL